MILDEVFILGLDFHYVSDSSNVGLITAEMLPEFGDDHNFKPCKTVMLAQSQLFFKNGDITKVIESVDSLNIIAKNISEDEKTRLDFLQGRRPSLPSSYSSTVRIIRKIHSLREVIRN